MAEQQRTEAATVAVVNTNEDLVNVLRRALQDEGFGVVTARIRDLREGRQDFSAFLRIHDPRVIIYDISVPYEENWAFLESLRQLPDARHREFIVTTVNKRILDKRVGRTEAIEIQGGRADDIDPVMDAVKAALRRDRPLP